MAKIRNKIHRSNDPEYLKTLAEETEFIGREFDLDLKAGTLTVLALPRRHKKSKHTKKKAARNKRAESAARRA